ncbi:MAG TPA: hypothetical protein VNO22_09485 [Planctomycetota bacterium]|jgi:hypothetical protein|nr:hypothetical protein [Planctomycetota bacterium]
MKLAWMLTLGVAAAGGQESDWPAPVKDFKAVEPGEHPRLLFRKPDLPRLKKIAGTPEGKAIVERLRRCLNGSDGETMPVRYGVRGAVNQDGAGETANDPPGTYTFSHAAGYGFLYQLTGDRKYAELGRQCMEKAFEGQRDRDRRYSFRAPYGALRAGPSLGWTALGYDLCYDGWDEEYRRKVARAIQDYNEGRWMSLEELARGARHHPGSNHWGMQVGGAAMALLAIMGDPGVDMGKLRPLLDVSRKSMIRNLTEGFGDGGFFAEGDGTGSMSSHIVFLPALQAWRVAGGQDFVGPRPNAVWTALKWIFLTVPRGGTMDFWPVRGGYPHNVWAREGLSGAGYFGISFGILRDEHRAGLLWFYNRHLREADARAGTPFDATTPYPHHAICSFVNWPWELKERPPEEVLPRVCRDTKWSFTAFRNRWQDENDIVISVLTKASKGYMSAKADGALQVAAFGRKFAHGKVAGDVRRWEAASDGSAVMTMADGTSVAIDFSGASGAEGMIVMTGPGAEGTAVTAGETTYRVKFLTSRAEPAVRAEGDALAAGRQKVRLKEGHLSLEVFAR